MTDLTLDDLTDTANGTDDSDTGTDDDGDDGLGRLFDYMIEQGYIDALATQQFGVEMTDTPTDTQVESGNDDDAELDAEAVSQFGKLVIDNVGDIPMSQVVKFAEQNPEQVNSLIDDVLE